MYWYKNKYIKEVSVIADCMVYGNPEEYFSGDNIEFWVHKNDETGVIDLHSSNTELRESNMLNDEEIEYIYSPYCPHCGSCGEPGCCPPEKCVHKSFCLYPHYENNLWIKIKRPFYNIYHNFSSMMFKKFKIFMPQNPFGSY